MRPVFKTLELAINRYIHLDPESKKHLRKLNDKTIVIEFLGINQKFALQFNDEKIHCLLDIPETHDVLIKGTPFTLFNLSIQKKNRNKFFEDDVVIEGDVEIANQVIELFDHLEIDWEEHVAKFVGDVPAHHIGRAAHSIKNFLFNAKEKFSQNLNEYLHEEKNYFPPSEMLQDFFHDIDQTRMDVDRLELRVKKLQETVQ